MMEMTVKEMQQVSGSGGVSGGVLGSATPLGGRGGIGGELVMRLGDDSASDDAASLLGRKPGVGVGSGGIGPSATPLGGRGGIGGEF
jgi:hypothetical protein